MELGASRGTGNPTVIDPKNGDKPGILQHLRYGTVVFPTGAIRMKATVKGIITSAIMLGVAIMLFCAVALTFLQFVRSPLPPRGLQQLPGFVPALITWEIFLGLWLASGTFPMAARRVAIGCFGIFSCYTFYEAISGKADCGCFGQVHVNPWFTMILDITIVLALVFLAKPLGTPSRWSKRKWPVAVALGIGLAVGIAAAVLHPRPIAAANGLATANDGQIVILEPYKWVGHRLPVLTHIVSATLSLPGPAAAHGISLGQRLAHGNWIVLFYHANCDECRQAIPVYEALAQSEYLSGQIPHVAFIRVPTGPAAMQPPGLFHTNAALHGTLDDTHEWFATTPTAVELQNAVVMRSVSGNAAMNLAWLR